MESLYDVGWRQGSILSASLPLVGVVVGDEGVPIKDEREHDEWVVATQNCDLDQVDAEAGDDTVELRPVLRERPPTDRGIRSRRYLLDAARYVEAQSRRIMISPAALEALLQSSATRDNSVADDVGRVTGFKTWLGYRYDRPAVPNEYIPLAKRIAEEVSSQRGKEHSGTVRDVLVQFEAGTPPRYALFAVILSDTGTEAAIDWLTAVSLNVPADLGVASAIEAGTADDTPLSLIESSFAADVTQLTWGGKTLRGEPGRLSHPHDLGPGPSGEH